jgi:hypothetical protein
MNVLLFDGQEVVRENELTDAQPFSYYKMDGKKVHGQERDVAKFWKNGEIRLSLIGLENQMKTDKAMPLRVIGYDGAAYRSQLNLDKKKNTDKGGHGGKKRYFPVISLVLYFGTKRHWNKNRSLKEVITVPDKLEKFVSDYKINVFELAWLTDQQIQAFKSDFREVALFLRSLRTGETFLGSDRKTAHIMEILDLFRVMSNNRLDNEINESYKDNNSTKGGINMGNPMQKYDNRIRKETEIEVAIGALKEKIAPETVAKIVKLPLEQILELQKQITVTA